MKVFEKLLDDLLQAQWNYARADYGTDPCLRNAALTKIVDHVALYEAREKVMMDWCRTQQTYWETQAGVAIKEKMEDVRQRCEARASEYSNIFQQMHFLGVDTRETLTKLEEGK